jgi:signal transduction histidine kinase
MKKETSIVVSFVLLVLLASLYRILPGRPLGFAPQIAMALFAGSIVKDKKFSFLLPLFSMLISDIIYEVLFHYNLSPVPGFYSGQFVNYLLFVGLTVVGFAVNQIKPIQILTGAIAGTTLYFVLSNFAVWIGGGLDIANLPYPKTMAGLLHCYAEAIPFYRGSLYATLIFSGVLFGGYFLINKYFMQKLVLSKA